MKDYELTGKSISMNGKNYYHPAYNGDGYIYKSEKAFLENPDEICYIPEHAFDDLKPVTIDGEDYYDVEGYSRNDLQELIGDGDFGDEELWTVDDFFYVKCRWAFPETYIMELSY